MNSYEAAEKYIYSLGGYEQATSAYLATLSAHNWDLRRVSALLERLGNPHISNRSIHVAGSKGKGSTAAMIASVLQASGYRTGLYTSPHLHTIRERIAIDGEPISEESFARLIDSLRPEILAMNAEARLGVLTFWEALTALAFKYFQEEQVDFQVIETGLGGRLDATNVVWPEVSVITPISLEHTAILGDTLAKIAGEKAGIIKPGRPVVVARQEPDADAVFEATCRERGCRLVKVQDMASWRKSASDLEGQQFELRTQAADYSLWIPLLGGHQLDNAATAVAVLELLAEQGAAAITAGSIEAGLARVRWPGRMEVMERRPLIVMDGAHNPASARCLREAIQEYLPHERLLLIAGTSADKEIEGIARELGAIAHLVIATQSRHPRATDVDVLGEAFRAQGCRVLQRRDVADALALATTEAGPADLICVTGSLFVVAEARGCLQQSESGVVRG